MTLPVMEPDVDADILKRWAQTIDRGTVLLAVLGVSGSRSAIRIR